MDFSLEVNSGKSYLVEKIIQYFFSLIHFTNFLFFFKDKIGEKFWKKSNEKLESSKLSDKKELPFLLFCKNFMTNKLKRNYSKLIYIIFYFNIHKFHHFLFFFDSKKICILVRKYDSMAWIDVYSHLKNIHCLERNVSNLNTFLTNR